MGNVNHSIHHYFHIGGCLYVFIFYTFMHIWNSFHLNIILHIFGTGAYFGSLRLKPHVLLLNSDIWGKNKRMSKFSPKTGVRTLNFTIVPLCTSDSESAGSKLPYDKCLRQLTLQFNWLKLSKSAVIMRIPLLNQH